MQSDMLPPSGGLSAERVIFLHRVGFVEVSGTTVGVNVSDSISNPEKH